MSTLDMSGICGAVGAIVAWLISGVGGSITGGPGGVEFSLESPTKPPSAEKSVGGSIFLKRTVPPNKATRITWRSSEMVADWSFGMMCLSQFRMRLRRVAAVSPDFESVRTDATFGIEKVGASA